MYLQVGSTAQLGSVGSPWITTGIEVPVRHFECLSRARAELDSWLPSPLPIAERIDMLKADAAGAAFLARSAAQGLEERSVEAVDAFKKTFGVSPDSVLKGFKESIGRIVQRRFAGAFKLLESGGLLYSCGLPVKGGGPESALEYRFKVKIGEYWIALGSHFWLEPFSDDRFAMILMGALRVAYGRWVTESALSASTANAFCYAKFAFLAQKAEPPPFVRDRCPELT
jgi:hypothetical protein